ncbi:hypothetical protein Btru_051667 [Bulinus truncatus]|nr:hypothetical protein Btru_051667 [Bulinus truncatus]
MDTSQLRQIASQSLEDYFFTVSTFTKLQDILKKVVEKTCIAMPVGLYFNIAGTEGFIIRTDNPTKWTHSLIAHSSEVIPDECRENRRKVRVKADLIRYRCKQKSSCSCQFSTNATVEFYLNEFSTNRGVKDKIATVLQRLGNTATGEALRAVRTQVLNTSRGYSPETPVVVIVVTDGKSQQPWVTREEAEALRNATVHTIVIGLEPDIDQQELNDIASSPPEKFVFKMTIYSALDSIKTIIGYKACTTGA